MKKKTLWRLFGIDLALLIVVLDQLSKYWIMTDVFRAMYRDAPDLGSWLFEKAERLTHAPILVTDWFSLVMVWNPGVSFGMLQNDTPLSRIGLAGFAVLVALGFMVWMWREARPMVCLPVGLIAGGALGNVWDRLRFGAVVDFLDLHIHDWHWPAFNLADSAITVGVVLLLLDQFFMSQNATRGSVINETC